MTRRFRQARALLVILFVMPTVGCGGAPAQRDPNVDYGPSTDVMLIDFAAMLKAMAKDNKKPPLKEADLDRYLPGFGGAEEGLNHKKIVYQWGNLISTDANAASTVLAYEKDAEANGGWVLMQDGNVKKMSAEEFKAAPKAPKAGK
jgi:hypothetical protein